MSRDPGKLKAFHLADALVLRVYEVTRRFPNDERFGLTIQLRRAAVSTCANIVEGSSRRTVRDYFRFIEMSLGSACEVRYLLTLSRKLKFVKEDEFASIHDDTDHVCRTLNAYISSLGKAI